MKIKVHIDSIFQEEMLQIQAPSRTPKIQQVVEFVESLDNNHRLKGKKRWRNLSYRTQSYFQNLHRKSTSSS